MGDDSTLLNAPEAAAPSALGLRAIRDDRYRVEGELGRGGLGAVLRAHDRELGRLIALKVPLLASGATRGRFLREALLTARLQHPSIVPVYEAGTWRDGEPFYAMKLVEGRTLQALLDEATTLERRLALLPNLIAVADAIAYAHQQHIIHRDLKPSNVVVGEFGETVVLDWGLAKELGEPGEAPIETSTPGGPIETAAGQVMGTPRYMAPEQAAGGTVDERADVYALGAILYHLLAGAAPHAGDGPAEVMARLAETAPTPLAERAPRAPRDLIAIADQAMARRPADRYRTAQAVADDLRRFATGQLVSSRAYSPWARLARFVRRHRAAVAVAAILLVALAVTGAVAVERVARARRDAEHRRDQLLLMQARAALARDPTLAIAWLEQYPEDGADWAGARAIASSASALGVARQVARHTTGSALSRDGRIIVDTTSRGAVERLDLATGKRRLLLEAGTAELAVFVVSGGDTIVIAPDRIWRCPPSGGCRSLWQRGDRSPNVKSWVSPDGRWIANATAENAVRLVDTATGDARELVGHTGEIYAVSFTADGRQLASVGADKVVRLWDAATGGVRLLAGHTDTVHTAAFSPDATTLATAGNDGTVRLWPVAGGDARVLADKQGPVFYLAYSPDGTRVASTSGDHAVRVWPVSGGEPRVLAGHTDTVFRVAFSPDGSRLASAGEDQTVRLWDLTDGDVDVLRGHHGPILDLAFAGDALMSWSFDGERRLWDWTRRASRRLAGPAGDVTSIAFSRDGTALAVASWDGSVRWCDPRAGTCRVLGRHEGRVARVAISPDGRTIASAGDDGVRLWAPDGTGRALGGHVGSVKQVVFSPDGRQLASGGDDHTVRLWDVASGHGDVVIRHDDIVLAVAFAPDGARLASGSFDHSVRLYDLASRRVRVLAGHAHWVGAIAFAPDGRHLASASFDGTIRMWDLADGRAQIFAGHDQAVVSLGFSPDGSRLASASLDATARVWDVASGTAILIAPHDGLVRRAVFSPDGRVLATGGGDRLVRLWDLASGEVRVVGAHGAELRDLAFSPDGAVLATAGNDHVVRLWSLAAAPATPPDAAASRAELARLTSAAVDASGALASP